MFATETIHPMLHSAIFQLSRAERVVANTRSTHTRCTNRINISCVIKPISRHYWTLHEHIFWANCYLLNYIMWQPTFSLDHYTSDYEGHRHLPVENARELCRYCRMYSLYLGRAEVERPACLCLSQAAQFLFPMHSPLLWRYCVMWYSWLV